MSYYAPKVSRGVGQLSGGAVNQMVDGGVWVQERSQAVEQFMRQRPREIIDTWIGEITASVSIATRRWKYTVTRVDLVSDPIASVNRVASLDASVFQGGGTIYAYNLWEWDHATGYLGDGTSWATIGGTFSLVPCKGVIKIDTWRTVTMSGATRTAVGTLNLFDRSCGIEGACE